MIRLFNRGFGMDHMFHQGFRKFRNQFFDLEKEFGKDMWAFDRNFFNKNFRKPQHQKVSHQNQAATNQQAPHQTATQQQATAQQTAQQSQAVAQQNNAMYQQQRVGDWFERRGFQVKKSQPTDDMHWVSGNKNFDNDRYFDRQYFAHAMDKENPWKNRFQGFARNYESKDGRYKEFFSFEKYEHNPWATRNVNHKPKIEPHQAQPQAAAQTNTTAAAAQQNTNATTSATAEKV